MAHSISYFQAIVIGLLQGITELFPVSSLGHAVLVPSLFGWRSLTAAQAQTDGFYLAFLVGLHVGTALGLVAFYRQRWLEMLRPAFSLIVARPTPNKVRSALVSSEPLRTLCFIVLGTIPVALVGLAFEHQLRVIFAKPIYAAGFLVVNGFILLAAEVLVRRRRAIQELNAPTALIVGTSQILALFAGISRSGATMATGLVRRLDHAQAADFAFLLATPVILLAGVYKLPDLLGPLGNGVRGQTLAASLAATVAAYVSVRFLTKWFTSHTLWPFGLYCIALGSYCLVTLS